MTSLSDLKGKVKLNPLEITKILDPMLFIEENGSSLSEHLNSSKQKSLAYHTSQNKNLTKPSIRKDVKFLDTWLKDMLGQIEQKTDYNFQSMIEDLQIIYSACLKEFCIVVKEDKWLKEYGTVIWICWKKPLLILIKKNLKWKRNF